MSGGPFVREEGQGEAGLLIHGLGASHRVFDGVFDEAGGSLRLLAVDLPCCGSSGGYAPTEPHLVAQALIEALDQRGLRKVRVFGHSFGGLVALSLAQQAPERVQRLVVASAPALGVPPEMKMLLQSPFTDASMGWARAWRPFLRPLVRSYMGWLWGDPTRMTEAHVSHYLETMDTEGFFPAMLEGLRSAAGFRLPSEALLEARLSIAVLWGDADRLVPVIHGEQIATALKAPLRVLPRVGHCLPEEAPGEVLAALRA